MATEKVVERILAQRPDITRDQLEDMINKKREASGDLLSVEGAAHLVAQDLLVATGEKKTKGLQISDLIPQIGDATLATRVIGVWPKQNFKRKDESEGTFVRLLLGDNTGTISCLVWNSEVVKTFQDKDFEGKIAAVSHGYTRQGLSEKVELHIGNRGSISLLPDDKATDIPSVDSFVNPLNKISDELDTVSIQGTIKTTPIVSSFETGGAAGTVLRMLVEDDTSVINVVAWNEKVEELKTSRIGDDVRILNGSVRKTSDRQFEVHLDKRSLVRLLNKPDRRPTSESFKALGDIKPTNEPVSVIGQLLSSEPVREIETKSGEKIRVSSILIGDPTGVILATLWRDNSALVETAKRGSTIHIQHSRVRERLGELTLDVGQSAKVVVSTGKEAMTNFDRLPLTKISQLKRETRPVVVEGIVAEEPSMKTIELKNGNRTRLASFRIGENGHAVRVSFWGDQAEVTVPLKVGDKVRIIGARVKEGFTDKWELHSNRLTRLELVRKKNVETGSIQSSDSILS
jgi:ssDNA-binding replication factor A large subunit